ncbi:hypothetical conserved protein [Candidatus Nitrosoglobus terrae]|uniref:Hypothetical conserved protein n=1 Tax=Candidatus Nitrosoglobus terrae TaxID=1630141 RepID=A0A1Q2SND4_9GAMM|nr:hypothetical protein [Candidatus Nitrosoglobus terrae]BAW80640.1 hypothetical conserved protein [Candidatus Nitrosoglobus terrae]
MVESNTYRSIFSPCSAQEQEENFESYWRFTQQHAGKLLEEDKDLTNKREKLKYFQDNPVRSRNPLPNPELFYRNYIKFKDDPQLIDRKTLLLTAIYKFARHEWVGISEAWNVIPDMAASKKLTDKISRVHLAEEFCHIRFFNEMLCIFHLDKVEWVPLGPIKQRVYRIFPRLPGALMDAPAFITELMGMTFYQHLDTLFGEILADEPEAQQRLREILHEIMVDEMAHVGQRRNFIGPVGIKLAQLMLPTIYRLFFWGIPEAKYLFNVEKMIQDGLSFDYTSVSSNLLKRSWVPSYCQIQN